MHSSLPLLLLLLPCLLLPVRSAPNPSIYGVRWFLGDHFSLSSLSSATPSRTHYILAFNSDSLLPGDVYLSLAGTPHTCTYHYLHLTNTYTRDPIEIDDGDEVSSGYFYKCNVNEELPEGQIKYEVQVEWSEFEIGVKTKQEYKEQRVMDRQIRNFKVVLAEGQFRVPAGANSPGDRAGAKGALKQNMLVLGDWGEITAQKQQEKHYYPVLESILARINSDPSISLVLFLGDLGYDFVGVRYISMLKYIQPLTSRMCFMTSPGNHDYVYHEDSFLLYAHSFLTPEWNKYYNFYYNFVLGDVLFISYMSEYISPDNTLIINPRTIDYLTQSLLSPHALGQHYHVVVFSHYPIFCSKTDDSTRTCQLSRTRLSVYMEMFGKLGMDLYLSGHVHYYERTHGVCWQQGGRYRVEKGREGRDEGVQSSRGVGDVYGGECPVYVVEGVAGNNYFEDEEGSIQGSDFTGKIAFNTGYGILSVSTRDASQPDTLAYSHYKMSSPSESTLADHFLRQLPPLSPSAVAHQQTQPPAYQYIDTDSTSVRVSQMIGILVFVLLGSVLCYVYGRVYVGEFGRGGGKAVGHVEMVEEEFGRKEEDGKKDEESSKGKKQKDIQ